MPKHKHPAYIPKLLEEHLPAWKKAYKKAERMDPHNEFVWRGVVMGWAVGRGMNITKAEAFSFYVWSETVYC